ncbi:hemolysin activation protein [Escherichia coli]|nr:hemolysin activation protein [Escherichia coli]
MAARNTSGDAGTVNSHTRYKLTLAELEAFNSAVDNRLAELTANFTSACWLQSCHLSVR